MVAQKCGGKVLHGVERLGGERRHAVGLGHADIESGEHIARLRNVAATHIDAPQKAQVINGKACYFFH